MGNNTRDQFSGLQLRRSFNLSFIPRGMQGRCGVCVCGGGLPPALSGMLPLCLLTLLFVCVVFAAHQGTKPTSSPHSLVPKGHGARAAHHVQQRYTQVSSETAFPYDVTQIWGEVKEEMNQLILGDGQEESYSDSR